MPEEKVQLTIDDLRKVLGPQAKIDQTMIVHYGRTTLHCQLETVQLDASNGVFHPVLKVIREIKPERQPRKSKEAVAAASKGKK